MPDKRQNIILIMADQLRADSLGCYGNTTCKTPNIDSICKSGICFDNAYTVCPVCSPARASLLTGLYPHNHKVIMNTGIAPGTSRGLSPALITFSQVLRNEGYHLEYFGKWHVHQDNDPLCYGFHNYTPVKRDKCEIFDEIRLDFLNGDKLISSGTKAAYDKITPFTTARSVCTYLQKYAEYSDNRPPLFLRVDFINPHFPNVIPEPFYSMYKGEEIPPWPNFKEKFEGKPMGHKRKHLEWGLQDKDWNWWSKVVALYYSDVSYLDFCCGRILDTLKNTGLAEDTMVVFTADHGDSTGSHRHLEKGGTMYEEVMRVPLIISSPSVECPGTRCDSFVRNMDLMPTFIKTAGADLPDDIDAVDLTPFMAEKPSTGNRVFNSVYTEYHGDVWGPYTQRMVRTKEFKYVFNPYDLDELYDLKQDPYEMSNLIYDESYTEELNYMRGLLRGWIDYTGDVLTHGFVTRNLPKPISPVDIV